MTQVENKILISSFDKMIGFGPLFLGLSKVLGEILNSSYLSQAYKENKISKCKKSD